MVELLTELPLGIKVLIMIAMVKKNLDFGSLADLLYLFIQVGDFQLTTSSSRPIRCFYKYLFT